MKRIRLSITEKGSDDYSTIMELTERTTINLQGRIYVLKTLGTPEGSSAEIARMTRIADIWYLRASLEQIREHLINLIKNEHNLEFNIVLASKEISHIIIENLQLRDVSLYSCIRCLECLAHIKVTFEEELVIFENKMEEETDYYLSSEFTSC